MSGILYPKVDPIKWAERYGIKIEASPCARCGQMLTPQFPIAHRHWRGLSSEVHEKCGEEYRQTVMVSIDEEFNDQLRAALSDEGE